MREKLIEILTTAMGPGAESRVEADAILAELRCGKCKNWADWMSGSPRSCDLYGVYFPDNGFCHQWEAK